MRLFTILGIIFLVVGIGLAVVPLLPGGGGFWDEFRDQGASIAALTFIPMGIIFTAIGVSFGRLTAGRRRLLREGVLGQATIVALERGNLVVNNINHLITFQLRVAIPGRAPYDVRHRQLVPIFALPSLSVGATVPVAVDPRDPAKLTIDLAGQAVGLRQVTPSAASPGQVVPNTLSTMRGSTPNAFSADLTQPAPGVTAPGVTPPGWPAAGPSFVAPSFVAPGLAAPGFAAPFVLAQGSMTVGPTMTLDATPTGQAANASLLANGRPGSAFIREANDTGIDVHGDSVVELTLYVTPQGGTAYEVHTATLVPAAARARALPGTTVPVRIDPAQPTDLAIDWQA